MLQARCKNGSARAQFTVERQVLCTLEAAREPRCAPPLPLVCFFLCRLLAMLSATSDPDGREEKQYTVR